MPQRVFKVDIDMTIIIRTDSSSVIGTGHIMRDLVLSGQFSEAKIIFAVQDLPGNINHKIKEKDYTLETLASNHIETFIPIVERHHPDMIVIDHYGIDERYEKQLKGKYPNIKLMVLDDTYKKHHCDILLNHNIYADKRRYKNLIPKHCELQCGKEFTLLRDEFKEEKTKNYPKNNKFTFFIAMGGADHSNINIDILELLEMFEDIEVHLVTTAANAHLKMLKAYAESQPGIHLHINSNKIAQLMRQSNFAIVTPSVTANEVLFMELPFIAIMTADNQREMYAYLRERNYVILNKFDKNRLKKYIQRAIQKVDLINFIDLSLDEKQMVLEWRNDDSIRKWMFTQAPISLESHLSYIDALPTKEDTKYFLVRENRIYIGVINFMKIDCQKSIAEIGLYAKPGLRGIGVSLMKAITTYAFNSLHIETLISEVFETNYSAIKLYEKFYFREISRRENIIIMELKNEDR